MKSQVEMVYDYMIAKSKKLKNRRECNICFRREPDIRFNSSVNVCSECWNLYAKMSKQEKKDMLMNKPARKISKEYVGTWAEYSERLNKSRDYLSVYRNKNPHIKTPQQAYEEVLARMNHEAKVCGTLDAIFDILAERKKLKAFHDHLVSNGIVSNTSIYRTRYLLSMERINLLEKDTLDYYELLIAEANKWM